MFNTFKVNKQFPYFLTQNQLNFDVERFVVAQTMIRDEGRKVFNQLSCFVFEKQKVLVKLLQ